MDGGGPRVNSVNSIASVYFFSLALSLLLFQSGIFTILTPLPQVFCYLRLGRWAGVSMAFIIFVVAGFFWGGVGLSYLLHFALPGVVLSESILRHYSFEKSFLVVLAITVAVMLGSLSLYASGKGVDTTMLVNSALQDGIDQVIAYNEKAGASQDHLREFKKAAPIAVDLISGIYRSLIVVIVMFAIWCNILVLSQVMRRIGANPPFGDLTRWRSPEYLVWGLIAAGMILFSGVKSLSVLAANLLLVLLAVYFFQGMAIISYYFNKKQLPGFFRGVGYFFIFIMWYVWGFVVALGLFDLWFDFRRLNRSEEI